MTYNMKNIWVTNICESRQLTFGFKKYSESLKTNAGTAGVFEARQKSTLDAKLLFVTGNSVL